MSLNSDLKKLKRISREVEIKLNPPSLHVHTILIRSGQSNEEAIASYEKVNGVKVADEGLIIFMPPKRDGPPETEQVDMSLESIQNDIE